jgi:hypothetical protein
MLLHLDQEIVSLFSTCNGEQNRYTGSLVEHTGCPLRSVAYETYIVPSDVF